ncbi:hypothetical protein [Gloeothece verrucosa]|uniref:Uncharacterized protein n=1 Tax=Gloeothece verrucosa (strain PCC 7822) TaxID=497965 RepID=E0UD70_GLOV7|nr:hypothetical protein [Gloeothece verrucosa]ADN12950.1 hypothetical protein Cyan7822_0936 [Gloeothece verrucosa PCC 7822]
MIKKAITTSLTLVLLQFTPSVMANSVLNFSSSHAEGRTGSIPSVTVWPGMGLSLNFSGTGERIVKAWLDDPSRLTLDFDTPISVPQENEGYSSTTIIHLRRIHSLKFAHLPATATTLLTVVTESGGTRNIYYFRVGYGSGQARYVAVNINSDPRPALQQRQRLEQNTLARANRIEQGLKIAQSRDTSKRNRQVFERVEILLAHVRGGMSWDDALRRTNLAPSVLLQLEALVAASD